MNDCMNVSEYLLKKQPKPYMPLIEIRKHAIVFGADEVLGLAQILVAAALGASYIRCRGAPSRFAHCPFQRSSRFHLDPWRKKLQVAAQTAQRRWSLPKLPRQAVDELLEFSETIWR
mmetsp:Transcript_520/g.1287  ORF Transcript_520/g.1287 Transcript_520/m.1287 type:complete len:117 (+) Transcript_520:27-377(+)